jgi:hypothetical protein
MKQFFSIVAIAIIALSFTSCTNQIKREIQQQQVDAASRTLLPFYQYPQPGQSIVVEGFINECPVGRDRDGFETNSVTYLSVVVNKNNQYISIPTTVDNGVSASQFWRGGRWSNRGTNSSGYYIEYGTFYYTGGLHKMHVTIINWWNAASQRYQLIAYSQPY